MKMRAIFITLLLSMAALNAGPAEAYKLHNGSGGASGFATTDLPTTADGGSSQAKPPKFNFGGPCSIHHGRIPRPNHGLYPLGSNQAIAPCDQ